MKRFNFKNVFGKKKPNPESLTFSTIANLKEMEEMLGKKQGYLEEQVQVQLSIAKKHGLKNKRAALAALKKKKRFETILQQVDGTLSTLEMQREALEQAKTNVSVLTAMKSAAQALKCAQMHMSVDKVHDVTDEIAEQQEVAQEISQAISNPLSSGFGTDVDDSELELELEAMEQEDLAKELLKVRIGEDLIGEVGSSDDPDPRGVPLYKDNGPPLPASARIDHSKIAAEHKPDLDQDLVELKLWASS